MSDKVQLLLDGVKLMVMGMVAVYVFLILMVFLELCLLHVSESSQKHFTPSILIFVLVNTISVHKRPRVLKFL